MVAPRIKVNLVTEDGELLEQLTVTEYEGHSIVNTYPRAETPLQLARKVAQNIEQAFETDEDQM